MKVDDIKAVAVIGCGTMGNGIAHVFAQTGYNVTLVDQSDERLSKAVVAISDGSAGTGGFYRFGCVFGDNGDPL